MPKATRPIAVPMIAMTAVALELLDRLELFPEDPPEEDDDAALEVAVLSDFEPVVDGVDVTGVELFGDAEAEAESASLPLLLLLLTVQ